MNAQQSNVVRTEQCCKSRSAMEVGIYTIFSNMSTTYQQSKMMEFKEELLLGLNVVMLKAGKCVCICVLP